MSYRLVKKASPNCLVNLAIILGIIAVLLLLPMPKMCNNSSINTTSSTSYTSLPPEPIRPKVKVCGCSTCRNRIQ